PQQYAGMSAIDSVILAGYPLCDGLLLAGVAWLAFTPGRRGASLGFLATGMSLILVADLAWNVGIRFDQSWDPWINPLYPIAYAAVAAAALHPSVRHLTERVPAEDTSVHGGRLTFLAAAMFAGPLAVMAADHDFGPSDVLLTLCSLIVVALVVGRFVGLVRENDRSRQRFRMLAESSPVGIYEVDESLCIGYANAEANRLFGEAVDGRRAAELLALVEPADRDAMTAAADQVLRGEPAEAEFRLHAADGKTRWVHWKGTPVPDRRRGYPRVFASTLDVTEVKRAHEEVEEVLRRQATHDVLTGLPNRRLLSDRLNQALTRRDRHPGTVALMFCDLDGFKTVNDVHGHDAGDAILVEISRRLCVTVRGTDSVARIGGDEFVILCEAAGTRDDLAHLADKVITAVNRPWRFGEHSLTVGVSVGIAIADLDDYGASLLRRADDAMYRAKADGRNRFEFALDTPTLPGSALPEVARLHHVGETDW
ncbi:MAG: diguanylate cyclase domain-containing protein, partial [Acidimicrobiia bacterium]